MKAVILAAGMGTRLNPLTDKRPKCLIEVNGESILKTGLRHLSHLGIEETVIVVGYAKEQIMDEIGYEFNSMKISYIENNIFDKTNNMYSLWLARGYLEAGCILIEGDVVFEEEIVSKLQKSDENKSYWLVDKFSKEMDGCMIKTKNDGHIHAIQIIRSKLTDLEPNSFKSVGILKITPEFGKHLSQWLSRSVKDGDVNIYYDLVISENINSYPVYALDVNGSMWFEIDDIHDLRKAETLFSRQ